MPSSPQSPPGHWNTGCVGGDGAGPELHGGDRAVQQPVEGGCAALALVVCFSVCLRQDKAEQINSAGTNQELPINMADFH